MMKKYVLLKQKVQEKLDQHVSPLVARATVVGTTALATMAAVGTSVFAEATTAPDYNKQALEAVTTSVNSVDFGIFFQMIVVIVGATLGVIVATLAIRKGIGALRRWIGRINIG